MKREPSRIVLVITAAIAVTLAASCSDSTAGSGRSNTPRVSLGTDDGELSSRLLSGSDVSSIAGLEQSTATDFDEVPAFENPDPRGPCGGVVPALDYSGAVGRAFAGTTSTALALVIESNPRLEAYFGALQADVSEVCGPYQSTTNTGQTQTVSDISVLPFPEPGVDAIGWTSTIEVGPQSAYIGLWLIEADGRFALIQYQGLEPISESAMVALAEGAYRRLTQ